MAERLKEQINPQHLPMPRQRASAVNAIRASAQEPAASRHYAGHHAGIHGEDAPYTTGDRPPRRPREVAPYDEEDDDALYRQRPPTSARRYLQPPLHEEVYTQGNRRIVVHREPPPPQQRRFHWLLFVGITLCVMLLGWVLLSLLANWWQTKLDDWKYGTPRTFQVDHYVGHGDSPDYPNHFIAVNLRGTIEVIEINTQLPKDDHIYVITTASDGSTPVSLAFEDINHDGKVDLLVTIGESNPYRVVMLNTGSVFQQ